MAPSKTIRCPTCQKSGPWHEGEFSPFCSKRCRLVDLGKWLGEEHRISDPLRPQHFVEEESDLERNGEG